MLHGRARSQCVRKLSIQSSDENTLGGADDGNGPIARCLADPLSHFLDSQARGPRFGTFSGGGSSSLISPLRSGRRNFIRTARTLFSSSIRSTAGQLVVRVLSCTSRAGSFKSDSRCVYVSAYPVQVLATAFAASWFQRLTCGLDAAVVRLVPLGLARLAPRQPLPWMITSMVTQFIYSLTRAFVTSALRRGSPLVRSLSRYGLRTRFFPEGGGSVVFYSLLFSFFLRSTPRSPSILRRNLVAWRPTYLNNVPYVEPSDAQLEKIVSKPWLMTNEPFTHLSLLSVTLFSPPRCSFAVSSRLRG